MVTVLDRYSHLVPGTEERVTDALDDGPPRQRARWCNRLRDTDTSARPVT